MVLGKCFICTIMFVTVSSTVLSRLSKIEVRNLTIRCRAKEKTRFNFRGFEYTDEDTSKLMHGINVQQLEAPFSVHLRYTNDDVEVNCGGTMISDRHVLTAAHCFVSKDCQQKDVVEILDVGGWKVFYSGGCLPFAMNACSKFQKIARAARIKSVAIPYEYITGPCFHSDIAIVTVKLKMTSLDKVACVAQDGDRLPDNFVLYSRGSDPTTMRTVTSLARINLTRISCFPKKLTPGVQDDQLCTFEGQEMNLCAGDSGSGLLYESAISGWNIAGVASGGTDCPIIEMALHSKKENKQMDGITLSGGVFTDIRLYTQFLCDHIGLCYHESQQKKDKHKALLLLN